MVRGTTTPEKRIHHHRFDRRSWEYHGPQIPAAEATVKNRWSAQRFSRAHDGSRQGLVNGQAIGRGRVSPAARNDAGESLYA